MTTDQLRILRRVVYILAAVAAAGWTAYEASGEWRDAVGPALGVVLATLAAANTKAPATPEDEPPL